MKLTRDIANKVYLILEDIGAASSLRESFIHAHIIDEFQHEWRFQGLLGFGGKFWNEYNYIDKRYQWRVSCYSEDENPKREQIIKDTNAKLFALAQTIAL